MASVSHAPREAHGGRNQKDEHALWVAVLSVTVSTGLAFALYGWSAAPGLTWAHYGTDGGDLLAAAVTNGVPHPSGYPLYTLLLRAWLAIGSLFSIGAEPAWLGNLFSAGCVAVTIGLTVSAVGSVLRQRSIGWALALVTGLLWMVAPLPWSQALITEVYALHVLLAALLGWVLIVQEGKLVLLLPVLALGMAHHLTFALLAPAILYWLWVHSPPDSKGKTVAAVVLGFGLGAAFYLRIPIVAQGSDGPPPVNWGYADNWAGFWWVVSGEAYRDYLFGLPAQDLFVRVAAWARLLSVQFTPIGLGLALIGLGQLDRNWPRLRTFALLWVIPISIYAIFYNTWDSAVYLLPVVWMCALWLGVGLAVSVEWLRSHWHTNPLAPAYLVVVAGVASVAILTFARWPEIALRSDNEARRFISNTLDVLEPGSILVSSADAETFALWYSAWGSGELLIQAPDTILVNSALYQYGWYRRLLGDLYPHVPGVGTSLDELLAANWSQRPIYFVEQLPDVPAEKLEPTGTLWRYVGGH